MQHASVQLKQFLIAFSIICKHCHHFLLLNNILRLQLQNYEVQKCVADGLLDHSQSLADKVKPQQIKSLVEINKGQVIAYFQRSISLKDIVQYRKIFKSLCVFILQYKTITFVFLLVFHVILLFCFLQYFCVFVFGSDCNHLRLQLQLSHSSIFALCLYLIQESVIQ